MFILEFTNFIIGLFLVFITIVIFHPINKYKKTKTKEDQLFLQKTLLTTIFFFLILIISILLIIKNTDESKMLFLIEVFTFNIYIIIIVLYNFFLSLELYYTYTNPVHFFNKLLKQSKYNYSQEIFIMIIAILISIFDIILYEKDIYEIKNNIKPNNKDEIDEDKNYFCNDSSIFILIAKWKSFFIVIFSLISILLCFNTKKRIKKFCFKHQTKLYNVIDKRNLSNSLYLLYGLIYIFPIFFNIKITEYYNIFASIFFLFALCDDFLIDISVIATTKFCEYRLRKKVLGYFCSWFIKPQKIMSSGAAEPLVNEMSINDFTGVSTFQNETNTPLEIITNNPKDKELIATYKNGIYMEDYFLGYFDQILNIISLSIFKVFNSNYFSSKANETILNNKIGTDVSSIDGGFQNITVNMTNMGGNKTVLTSKSEVGEDVIQFQIKKNFEGDEFHSFKQVLENGTKINDNNNYLDVNIKSFFTSKCVECIYAEKLKGKIIANSFLSHMILNNNAKNQEYSNTYYHSLLASNGKEEYFNKLKNTSIKTFDKKFTLDIFDTDDQEINILAKGNNSNTAKLLEIYFDYIKGKGINGTFIPLLLGVFKIKINNFKTLLIFVTKNSLVENAPKSFYTYWQLIRFLNEKPQKLTSSQFSGGGTLVKDDPIFERSFQIETKKDNPNYNKIFVKNFSDFEETIKNDVKFLKDIGVHNFYLLLMYYEYENTQKHEKQGVIKIRKSNLGAELIEESMPKGELFNDDSCTPISKFGSKNLESLGGGFLSLGGGFFDENDLGGKNMGNKVDLVDFEEKINMNQFEGLFDSFNCMCFFTFENVFDIRNKSSMSSNYYKNFEKNVMVNFTDFKNSKK